MIFILTASNQINEIQQIHIRGDNSINKPKLLTTTTEALGQKVFSIFVKNLHLNTILECLLLILEKQSFEKIDCF